MNPTKIQRFFAQRCARKEALVLVTVEQTEGSTYSKAGDQMLIDAHGVGCGMLSGGCLESDLAVRAQVVLESGDSQSVTYDLASGDDDIWGLGIGCDGSMTIGLQRIAAENDYAPFDLPTPIRLLILGAGLDAIPLTRIADEIGWSCTIVDHRPAYIDHAGFPGEFEKHCIEAAQLAATAKLVASNKAKREAKKAAAEKSAAPVAPVPAPVSEIVVSEPVKPKAVRKKVVKKKPPPPPPSPPSSESESEEELPDPHFEEVKELPPPPRSFRIPRHMRN